MKVQLHLGYQNAKDVVTGVIPIMFRIRTIHACVFSVLDIEFAPIFGQNLFCIAATVCFTEDYMEFFEAALFSDYFPCHKELV